MSEFYSVKKGDNLTKIARENSTTVRELLKLNPNLKKSGNLIFVGDKINLPASNTEDINMNVQGLNIEINSSPEELPAEKSTDFLVDSRKLEAQVFKDCGLSIRELSDKNIVAEYKRGKIVYTDVIKKVQLSEEEINKLNPNKKQVNNTEVTLQDIKQNTPTNTSENVSVKPPASTPADVLIDTTPASATENPAVSTSENISNEHSENEIVNIALKYKGYNKHDGSYKLFTGGARRRWCADFVSYVAREYGKKDFKFSSVSQILQWGKDNDTFHKDAQVGDIIIFKGRNKKGKRVSHTGIVTSVENGIVKTIEGNASGKVAEREYSLYDSKITGYVSLA